VVDGAATVQVTLRDGRTFEGQVVGIDSVTDVAAVKVKADTRRRCAWVIASGYPLGSGRLRFGNPLGLDNTVTADYQRHRAYQ
jgi:S1-C subfamily serine protease